MQLDDRAKAISEIYGMPPNDLMQLALDRYIDEIIGAWYNVETYAVVMEIRSNPDWQAVCHLADDYTEWSKLMVERGMTVTRSGIDIKDRRIARRRIDPEIRKRTKDYAEEKTGKR